mmetsp:Transcript_6757/g.27670  ORF Transcript_6757/g.27670 Transcript_6757/m.27670 type:complete len:230 (-) Transcript_6757:1090-1779(-)
MGRLQSSRSPSLTCAPRLPRSSAALRAVQLPPQQRSASADDEARWGCRCRCRGEQDTWRNRCNSLRQWRGRPSRLLRCHSRSCSRRLARRTAAAGGQRMGAAPPGIWRDVRLRRVRCQSASSLAGRPGTAGRGGGAQPSGALHAQPSGGQPTSKRDWALGGAASALPRACNERQGAVGALRRGERWERGTADGPSDRPAPCGGKGGCSWPTAASRPVGGAWGVGGGGPA